MLYTSLFTNFVCTTYYVFCDYRYSGEIQRRLFDDASRIAQLMLITGKREYKKPEEALHMERVSIHCTDLRRNKQLFMDTVVANVELV